MSRTFQLLTVLVTAVAAACASSAPAPDSLQSPVMISRGAPPQLQVPMMSASGRSPVRVTIHVLIEPDGRPDMSTFKVSGFGAAENEQALRQWIESAAFKPAHRGTEAVEGFYEAKLEVRVEVRRGS